MFPFPSIWPLVPNQMASGFEGFKCRRMDEHHPWTATMYCCSQSMLDPMSSIRVPLNTVSHQRMSTGDDCMRWNPSRGVRIADCSPSARIGFLIVESCDDLLVSRTRSSPLTVPSCTVVLFSKPNTHSTQFWRLVKEIPTQLLFDLCAYQIAIIADITQRKHDFTFFKCY